MATPLRLGGPDAPPGGTSRTGYTTVGSQGWAAPQTRGYSGPVYGSWAGRRARPPKIKNAKQRALLFIRNTNGKPGGRWVARRPATAPVVAPPAASVAATPGYTGPYADLPEWARKVMLGIDSDFAGHSKYVGFNTDGTPTGSGVASWLSSALNGLNTAAGGMLGEYQSNMGNVAGAVQNAAGALPAQVNSPLAGGIVSSPQAYDYYGRSQGMAGEADSIRGQASAFATQARSNLGLASQGYINSLADYAKGLPAMYAEKRRAAREGIDQFLANAAQEQAALELDQAKLAETQRSNQADEAIRTLNARNGLITALVNSGIKIDANTMRAIDIATDNQRQASADRVRAADVQADNARADRAETRQQRTADARVAGGGSTGRTAAWYKQRGYTRPGGQVNVGRINRQVFDVGRDNAGNVWVKKRSTAAANGGGTGGGSGSGGSPAPARDLWPDFQVKYREIGGRADDVPAGPQRVNYVANQVVAWIVNKNKDFTKNGAVDKAKILAVIQKVIGPGDVRTLVGRLLDKETKMVNGKLVWR